MQARMEALALSNETKICTPTGNAIRCSWKEAIAVPQRGC